LEALRKNFFCCEQSIQGSGKASIDRHVHQHFDDFFTGQPNIQPRLNMDLELRRGIPIAAKDAMVAIWRDRRSKPGREQMSPNGNSRR
jgi:hypothetical protein